MATIDNFFVLGSLFALAIVFLAGITMWDNVNVDAVFGDNPTAEGARSNAQSFYSNLDIVFVLAYFGFHIGVIVLAWGLRSHPVVYPAGLILIILLTVLAAPLSNAYETTAATTGLTASSAQLSITGYIMGKLPMLEVVFGFLTLILLAGMARNEGIL